MASATFAINTALCDYTTTLRLQVILKELVDEFEIGFTTVHPGEIGLADVEMTIKI